jgi:tetratricopeptide (TPR) repeat protein
MLHWPWLVVAVALLVLPSIAHGQDATADDHYRQGVELAKQGNFRAAREEFETAFELSPHPGVLYTLAKISLEMDDRRSAKEYLRRYLEMDLRVVATEQVEEVRQALRALEEQSPADGAPAKTDATTAEADTEPGVAPGPTPIVPETAADSKTATDSDEVAARPDPEFAATAPASVPPRPTPPQAATPRSPVIAGVVLLSTGVLAALTGGGIWLWNDAKHERLLEERSLLEDTTPSPTPDEFAAALAHARAVGRNDEAFDGVRRFDVVIWSLVGIGAASVGAGLWLLLGSSESTEDDAVAVVPQGVRLRW